MAEGLKSALKELYSFEGELDFSAISKTRKDFEGDRTIVVFPYLKIAKKKPEETATEIGNWLKENLREILFLKSKVFWTSKFRNFVSLKVAITGARQLFRKSYIAHLY